MRSKHLSGPIFLFLGWIFSVFLYGEQGTLQTLQTTEVPLIPRQLLFGNPEKTSPQLSPDGTQLAYLAPNAQGVLNIWVRHLQSPQPDRQITHETKRGIHSFLWQFDSASLLYPQDKEGDENEHLYQVRLQTGTIKDLTPYEGVRVSVIAYEPHSLNEMLIQMNQRDSRLFDVYRLNLQTGELKLEVENPGDVIQWVADHHLQVRAAGSYTSDGSTLIRVREQSHLPWRDRLIVPPTETCVVEGFSADEHSLYVMTNLEANTIRLFTLPLANEERHLIFEDPHYDLSELFIHPKTHVLQAIGIEREYEEWEILDPQFAADFRSLARTLKGPFRVASTDLANQTWVIASQSDQRPLHFYLYQRDSKKLTFLFSRQPELEKYSLSPMQPISFQARDGMTLYGYLTLPIGLERGQYPAVLLVHGGPWSRDSWGMHPTVQWLANRGYAVLQINYRGSTGYGKAYLNAGNREWSAKMQSDLLDGKNWLIEKGIADLNRVAIYGGSYGGYATLVGLTFTPDAFCCGVDLVGPSNLVTLLKTFPPYWLPLKSSMDLRIGKLETEEEFLKACSPLFKVEQIKKPLLIGQGANDPRVKQAESDQIVQAMRQKGLPVEYLLFTDEGHGFARPENRLKFQAAVEAFLARHLGGRSEPCSQEENWESVRR